MASSPAEIKGGLRVVLALFLLKKYILTCISLKLEHSINEIFLIISTFLTNVKIKYCSQSVIQWLALYIIKYCQLKCLKSVAGVDYDTRYVCMPRGGRLTAAFERKLFEIDRTYNFTGGFRKLENPLTWVVCAGSSKY